MPMATRNRSKAGKGKGSPSSPAQYQTLLSYSTLKKKSGLKEKQKEVRTSTEANNVETNTDKEISTVQIKQETIDNNLVKSNKKQSKEDKVEVQNEQDNTDEDKKMTMTKLIQSHKAHRRKEDLHK